MTDAVFFDKLFADFDGTFTAVNLCDAVATKTLPKSVFKDFSADWHDEFVSDLFATKPIDVFAPTVTKVDTSGDRSYSLLGPKLPRLGWGHIATTVDASYLASGFSSASQLRYASLLGLISDFGSATNDALRDTIVAEIIEYLKLASSDKNGLLAVDFHSGIKGPNPNSLIWFTSYDESGQEEVGCWLPKRDWSARADKTRDILGLDHFGSNYDPANPKKPCLLATIVLPMAHVPASQEFFRPTPLDEVGRRFKSSFGDLRKSAGPYGRTVNLDRFVGPRPHRGGREVITKNFAPTGEIFFTILGETHLPRSDWVPINDSEFSTSILRKRKESGFCSRLEKMAKR